MMGEIGIGGVLIVEGLLFWGKEVSRRCFFCLCVSVCACVYVGEKGKLPVVLPTLGMKLRKRRDEFLCLIEFSSNSS